MMYYSNTYVLIQKNLTIILIVLNVHVLLMSLETWNFLLAYEMSRGFAGVGILRV